MSSTTTSNPDQRNRTFFWVAACATVLAIFDHIYLLTEHYQLRFGDATAKSICNISEHFSCAVVSASRYSEFLGIPMAMWGIGANTVLLLLIVWYPMTDDAQKPAARRNLLITGGAIALTSVIMGFISTVFVGKLCPFCMLAYLLSFISFLGLWFGLPKPKALAAAAAGPKDFAPLLILGAIAALGCVIANDQVASAYRAKEYGPVIQEALEAFATGPQVNIDPVNALVAGAPNDQAKVVVTEFADFRCPHCRHAAPVMDAFVGSHPDVQLRFMAWPLDGECNTSIPTPNGASCLLARAVYCAEKNGGHGWQAHRYIYDHQEDYMSLDAVKAKLADIAAGSGIPAEQMNSCTASPEAKTAVEKEAAVGSALNIQGTPTVYVNGKKVPGGQVLPVLSAVYEAARK